MWRNAAKGATIKKAHCWHRLREYLKFLGVAPIPRLSYLANQLLTPVFLQPFHHLVMLTLFHHSFCPHSRFVRLVLEEYGLESRCVEEKTWERRKISWS